MEKINALLQKASAAYYEGTPIMSDAEFDSLAEIHDFDEVGTKLGNRTPHLFQMYSLQKVFEDEVQNAPFKDYKGAVVVTPKLDGAAVSLLYVGGILHRALTRGDGKEGLDVKRHLVHLVPQSLPNIPSILQITGEVVAPKTYKNARNYAAGALGLKDGEEFCKRKLTFIAYGVQHKYKSLLWSKDLKQLNPYINTVLDRDWTEFPDDGLVFRVDSNKHFEDMGYTAHHPRGAYAFKTRQVGVETTLVDVLWNVGKSGVVAPVAILDPIEIDGAMISRETLHNMAHIEGLNLEIGCQVEVIRSGEIIPRIVRRL